MSEQGGADVEVAADPADPAPDSPEPAAPGAAAASRRPGAGLRSRDDSDLGWGDDLRRHDDPDTERFTRERPPHWE